MDAKTLQGDDVVDGKYPSLLEDFQTGTASMARKRHLASNARGFCGCRLTQNKGFKRFNSSRAQEFRSGQTVKSVVKTNIT